MLKKLILENFRNYKKAEVEFNSSLVLILGSNAAGKTNIAEAIYYLSHLKSFRAKDNYLAKTGEDFFKIEATYDERNLEIAVQASPLLRRAFRIDGQKITRLAWQPFRSVLFEPSDLELFSQGPNLRRKYLNQTISQMDKLYAADIASLEHILKQKSMLLSRILQGGADRAELEFWNDQLSEAGLRISEARSEFLGYLNTKFINLYQSLTGFKDKFEVFYKNSAAKNKKDYLDLINSYEEAEVRSGMVLVGPHRDDFTINKNDLPNVVNSSRGELRSQILAIKLLQAEYLSKEESKPVVILDDVFSELDETRRSFLLENLKSNQIFITSTEEHHLPKLKGSAQIIQVAEGVISS